MFSFPSVQLLRAHCHKGGVIYGALRKQMGTDSSPQWQSTWGMQWQDHIENIINTEPFKSLTQTSECEYARGPNDLRTARKTFGHVRPEQMDQKKEEPLEIAEFQKD